MSVCPIHIYSLQYIRSPSFSRHEDVWYVLLFMSECTERRKKGGGGKIIRGHPLSKRRKETRGEWELWEERDRQLHHLWTSKEISGEKREGAVECPERFSQLTVKDHHKVHILGFSFLHFILDASLSPVALLGRQSERVLKGNISQVDTNTQMLPHTTKSRNERSTTEEAHKVYKNFIVLFPKIGIKLTKNSRHPLYRSIGSWLFFRNVE